MNIIYQDQIAPAFARPETVPDWDKIAGRVKPYGALGEEIYLRARTIDLYNKQDWANYGPVAKEYLDKYGTHIGEQERTAFQAALSKP